MTISHQGFIAGDGKHPGHCTGPNHPDGKSRDFEGRVPDMDRCHSCWYNEAMDEADAEFKPLIEGLVAAGLDLADIHVDQTGGMVMCLRIVVDRGATRQVTYRGYKDIPGVGPEDRTVDVTPERYIYVSDMTNDDEPANFGYYDDVRYADDPDDPDEYDCEGENFSHDSILFGDGPAFGRWIADWVVVKRQELNAS